MSSQFLAELNAQLQPTAADKYLDKALARRKAAVEALRDENEQLRALVGVLWETLQRLKAARGTACNGLERLKLRLCRYCRKSLEGGRADRQYCDDHCRIKSWKRKERQP